MEFIKSIVESLCKLPKLIIFILLLSFQLSINSYPQMAERIKKWIFADELGINFASRMAGYFVFIGYLFFIVVGLYIEYHNINSSKENTIKKSIAKKCVVVLVEILLTVLVFQYICLVLIYPTYSAYRLLNIMIEEIELQKAIIVFTSTVFYFITVTLYKKYKKAK